MARQIEIGSGSVHSDGIWGGRYDYEYSVPAGAINVTFSKEDESDISLNIGSGNGNASLRWDKDTGIAHVHAWVNGKLFGTNRVSWTVYAWVHH